RDFNEFRRRLAEGVPAAKVAAPERQSSGKITAQVEEKRPAATAPDKLTLSKAAAQGQPGTEDKIAKKRAAQDTATRVAELSKNTNELNSLGKGAGLAAAAASVGKPGVPVPLGAPTNAAKPAPTPAPASPVPAPAVVQAAKPASEPAPVAATASAPAAA